MRTILRKHLPVSVPAFTRTILSTARNSPHSPGSSLPDYTNPDENPDWLPTPSAELDLDFSTAFEISIAASFDPPQEQISILRLVL